MKGLPAVAAHQNVWRLHIEVDDAVAVKEIQAASDVQGDALAHAGYGVAAAARLIPVARW